MNIRTLVMTMKWCFKMNLNINQNGIINNRHGCYPVSKLTTSFQSRSSILFQVCIKTFKYGKYYLLQLKSIIPKHRAIFKIQFQNKQNTEKLLYERIYFDFQQSN